MTGVGFSQKVETSPVWIVASTHSSVEAYPQTMYSCLGANLVVVLSLSNTRHVAFETDSGIERADREAETNERSDNGRCWTAARGPEQRGDDRRIRWTWYPGALTSAHKERHVEFPSGTLRLHGIKFSPCLGHQHAIDTRVSYGCSQARHLGAPNGSDGCR
jgi:hypothetical protein